MQDARNRRQFLFPPGLLLYKIDCNIYLSVVAHKCKEDQRISRNLGFAMMISIL